MSDSESSGAAAEQERPRFPVYVAGAEKPLENVKDYFEKRSKKTIDCGYLDVLSKECRFDKLDDALRAARAHSGVCGVTSVTVDGEPVWELRGIKGYSEDFSFDDENQDYNHQYNPPVNIKAKLGKAKRPDTVWVNSDEVPRREKKGSKKYLKSSDEEDLWLKKPKTSFQDWPHKTLKKEHYNFKGRTLFRPNFDGCTLEDPDFSDCTLVDASFKNARIIGGTFKVRCYVIQFSQSSSV